MKLTKIEIYGFKSFYNKTAILPGAGITAIVGPNGCGKSNVADAIRWVMGEQSSKILRGGSMVDVIFNGTAQRKSLSYAEVSLCFDNSDKSMAIDYDEVSITRKLYRSGDSEYLINGKNVRLKDITNLIRASQMGREGYSIIGQGKVEEFINSKPEERRTLFDEATGIAGSKAKRNEAERKLSKADDNIIRYKDILQEIDRNLEPLKEQSESAKKYFSYKESLKYNEINYYLYKKSTRDKEVEVVMKKITALKEELSQKSKTLEEANEEYLGILQTMDGADEAIKQLHEKQLSFSLLKEKEDGKRKLHSQKLQFLSSQLQSIEGERERLQQSLVKEQEKVSRITIDMGKLLDKLEEVQRDGEELSLQLDGEKTKASEIARKISHHEKQERENIYSAHDIQSEIAKLEFEKQSVSCQEEELKERIAQLEIELAEQSVEKQKCQESGERFKAQIVSLQSERFEEEAKSQELALKLQKSAENIIACEKFISESDAKEKMVRELKNSFEGYSVPVKRLMGDANMNPEIGEKIEGTVANLLSVPKHLEQAIESALQNGFQNVVTKSVQDAKKLISYLRDRRYGQVTFLPLDTVKPRNLRGDQMSVLSEVGVLGRACDLISFEDKYRGVFESLLGAVVVVDTIDSGIAVQKKYNSGFKIVTKLGEIFATSGSVTGGSAKQGVGNVLSHQNKLDDIIKERERAVQKKLELEDIAEKIKTLESRAREQVASISQKMQSTEVQKAQGIEMLKSATIAEQRSIFEKRSVDQRLQEATSRLEEIQGEIARLQNASKAMKNSEEKTTGEIEEYKQTLEQMQSAISKMESVLSGKNLDMAKIQGEIQNFGAQISSCNENISQNEFLIDSCKDSYSKIASEQQELREEVFEEIDEEYISNLKNQLEKSENSKKQLAQDLQKVDLQKGYLSVEVQKITSKKQSLEMQAEGDGELQMMRESIVDEYGETDLEVGISQDFNPNGARTQIKKLKADIFALGNINTQAIEDYLSTSARHQEMTKQKEDMEKAQADLRTVIDGLNVEMNEKFFGEFEKIDENFNKIFTELFGGGKARLALIENNSGDRLTYGIDIEAEPPGKTLQSMTLLSGGEKALTAIAIIIAIMRARPMPFCVFDEIEAALDDVNCKRFASYINNFADSTQFILITHKKSTMEVAQNLFGVTMEEKGLSKLVSVSMNEV